MKVFGYATFNSVLLFLIPSVIIVTLYAKLYSITSQRLQVKYNNP